jgi:ADP-heptose:LPS heptosyltransferase
MFSFSAFSPKKILLIRTDRLGDAVVTTPMIAALKDFCPDSKIYILTSTQNELIFRNNPYIEKVYTINVDNWLKYRPTPKDNQSLLLILIKESFQFIKKQLTDINFWRTLIQLKFQNLDLSIDLVGRKRTSLLGMLIAKHSITHDLKSFWYMADYCLNIPFVSAYPKKHIVKRYFDLASQGIKNFDKVNPFNYELELYGYPITNVEKRKHILFHVGGLDYRRIDNNILLNIIKEFASRAKRKVYLLDEPKNPNLGFFKRNLVNYKIEFIDKMNKENLINFVGENIYFAFVPDGGTAHLCTTLTNTLVYFGPGAVWVWYPWSKSEARHVKTYSNRTEVWETKGKYLHRFIFYPILCSPCFDVGCNELHCLQPLQTDFFTEQLKELV